MFLLVSGSAGAGKSHSMQYLRHWYPAVSIRDLDEYGVPADKAGRQERLEKWVQEALRLQNIGESLILVGQSPFGELLACPSTPQLNCVGGCLLDCHDHVRIRRERWIGWTADDSRWKVSIIDTSTLSGEEVAKQIHSLAAETITNPVN